MRGGRQGQNQRRQLAVVAARILSEEGVRDFHLAKLKAAQRLGLREDTVLPANREIEAALKEHQRLFRSEQQPRHLRALRTAALEAMHYLAQFQPRLVGSVLEGTADVDAGVTLHLFADTAETVIGFLEERGLPFEVDWRRLRLDRSREAQLPLLHFEAGGVRIELIVFPEDGIRQAPLGPVDARPMRRAGADAVAALLQEPPDPDTALPPSRSIGES